jgi:hypothetical protein
MRIALIGVAATIAVAVLPLGWQSFAARRAERQALELLDVLAYDGGDHVILDLRVSNPSTSTAYLTRFAVLIDTVGPGGDFCCIKESAHDYSIDLSKATEVPISHAVPPGGVERFTVTLARHGDPGGADSYRLRPLIVYNARDSVVGPHFLIYLRGITSGKKIPVAVSSAAGEPSFEDGWRDVRKAPEIDPFVALWPRPPR